jgi:hypothetical protein
MLPFHLFSARTQHCQTKTKTAKGATEACYRPLLIITNLVYIILLLGLVVGRRQEQTSTAASSSWLPYGVWGCGSLAMTWGLQYYAYMGILEQSANHHNPNKKKKGTNSRSNGNLVGGMYLDLLGLTLVIQFMSVLHSSKWFWLLLSVPLYGLYNLYTTFYGGSSDKQQKSSPTMQESDTDVDSPTNQQQQERRREQRAERRKHKWG